MSIKSPTPKLDFVRILNTGIPTPAPLKSYDPIRAKESETITSDFFVVTTVAFLSAPYSKYLRDWSSISYTPYL